MLTVRSYTLCVDTSSEHRPQTVSSLSSKTAALSSYALFPVQVKKKKRNISTLYQGILAGFDQKFNVILSDSKERRVSQDSHIEEVPLGLYLVKGDMMYAFLILIFFFLFIQNSISQRILVGELDDAIDSSLDLSTLRAEAVPPIRY
jgi:U6 snRNA-associated Sm-like protein LSm8